MKIEFFTNILLLTFFLNDPVHQQQLQHPITKKADAEPTRPRSPWHVGPLTSEPPAGRPGNQEHKAY